MLEKWLLPIIFVVVFVTMTFVFSKIMKRIPKLDDKKFDERQIILRSTGYKYSFLIMVIYFALYGFFDMITGIQWCETIIGCVIGILISVTFFSVYDIINNSYEATKNKNKYNIVIFSILGISNLLIGLANLFGNNNVIVEGKLTYQSLNLLLAIMFLIVLIAYIYKNISDKKDNMAEEI